MPPSGARNTIIKSTPKGTPLRSAKTDEGECWCGITGSWSEGRRTSAPPGPGSNLTQRITCRARPTVLVFLPFFALTEIVLVPTFLPVIFWPFTLHAAPLADTFEIL